MHPLLRRLDLNLLLVFDALYRHRNVGTAASEVGGGEDEGALALSRYERPPPTTPPSPCFRR